jgi:hypothetical protein
VNQGKTGYCGPAALLYHFAVNDPEGYAELALDLLENGQGWMRGTTDRVEDLSRAPNRKPEAPRSRAEEDLMNVNRFSRFRGRHALNADLGDR